VKSRALFAAAVLLAAGCAGPESEGMTEANATAEAAGLENVQVAAAVIQLDFDGDGSPEAVTEIGASEADNATFDSPWARSTGATPTAAKQGDRLLLVRGDKIGAWALGDAVYDQRLPLRHGAVPIEFRDCWNDPKHDALFVGTEDAAGVIAWKTDKFEWIQCGD
jgi:hypothetical protein